MLGSLLLTVIETLGGLLSGVLLARFIMQWQRVSFRNPIGQFVVATTDWLVLPLRRFIPGLGGLDLASLLPRGWSRFWWCLPCSACWAGSVRQTRSACWP
jgi:YggT family protein